MEIDLAPGSSATVLPRAANKVHRGDEAFQGKVARVGEGASLEYMPHHLIPCAGSNSRQETTFLLSSDSTLIA